jgi:5-methylcytosine-specific restriction enzyme subunit McrC
VYNDYWQSEKAMLLYPANATSFETKDFTSFNALEGNDTHHACGFGKLAVFEAGSMKLDDGIGRVILGWFVPLLPRDSYRVVINPALRTPTGASL